MDISMIPDLISTLGFPIFCVIGLCIFVWKLYQNGNAEKENLIQKMDNRNQEREDKLYTELAECRIVNNKAIETIAVYAEKLNSIQSDVKDIKSDIIEIKSKG